MTDAILSHQYQNGLVLVAEPMPWLDSAAFTFLAPCGSIHDPLDRAGLSSFACEMMLRGAGSRDSRRLINDLDKLGVERGEGVSDSHTSFSAPTMASNLPKVLAIYADVLRKPHLPEDQLDAARLVMEQELQSIEDDLQHKVMVELRRRHFPAPWGRPSQGDLEGVAAVSIDDVRRQWELYRPNGAILGVAGRFDFNELIDQVGKLFDDWKPGPEIQVATRDTRVRLDHIPQESTQTQIGIAYPAVPYRHDDYFRAWAAVAVLSGGMSSRLFTEVREKRGLCYSVYASYHTYRELAAVVSYAGTTAARAQETLDVMTSELLRLEQGIEAEEIDRLKTRVKTTLVMQQESSSSRSSSLARDWYHLGRARTLGEISGLVDGLTRESINAYLAEHPPRDFTFLTLGPDALTPPKIPALAGSNGKAAGSVAPFEFKQHKLANGLEIVAECQPSAASSAIAFFVSTGARDETPDLSGVSHFLEHMVFKGTPTRTPDDVNREFDEIGAQFNAFTSDEATVYYAFVLPEYMEKVVELWADVLRPSLREEDFDKEKQVILEEIGMYLDQPPYGADDRLKALYFGQHPLAGSVLGTKESVSAIQASGMRKYFEARYSPQNIVVAAVGQVDFPKLVGWAEKYCGHWKPFDVSRAMSKPEFRPSFLAIEKATSAQQYLMHMSPGPAAQDPDRYAAKLLGMVLGDDTGSRLYWDLVDPGLAESVSLGHAEYVDCGAYSTFLSCDPERTAENLDRVLAAYRKVEAEGITSEELEQAKSKVNSNIVLRGERPRGRLFNVGGNWTLRREYRSIREDLETVAAITVDDIHAVLKRYPLSKGTTVTIGPAKGLKAPG